MLQSIRGLTAWLCLTLSLLSGLTPARGFVVCIENDGCIAIEIKAADQDCKGCHESGRPPSFAPTAGVESSNCPCVDVVFPGSDDEVLNASRAANFEVGPWIAPAPPCRVPATSEGSLARGLVPDVVAREPDALVIVRSKVLLV